jgi:hypothetical protein
MLVFGQTHKDMLHLQTSNQSPITFHFGILPIVEAAVAVVAVVAAISYLLNSSSAILALNIWYVDLMNWMSFSSNHPILSFVY